MPKAQQTLLVRGREVPVSSLDKVIYPKARFTKADVIHYYIQVAPVLLPHLKDRPLTLKRYPDGVEGGFFYEKRCPPYRPKWVPTTPMPARSSGKTIHFCVANDLPTIVWAANLGDLELHTVLARAPNLDQPTMMVFDLDPGPPATIIECCIVGMALRAKLEKLGLESHPKTSGSKGLQVYVPLNTRATYHQTKTLSHELARQLESELPKLVVSRMQKNLRAGKVLVDWSQNDYHKTTVSVYSLRAKEQPTVSTPLLWKEVAEATRHKKPGRLAFVTTALLQRVEEHGDLFSAVLKQKQTLPALT